jgi:aspartate racemase
MSSDPAMAGRSIEAVASAHLAALDDALERPAWPIQLCGHSLGGLIAFEMACQLQAAGRPVGLLAVIDTPLRGSDRRSAIRCTRDGFANLPGWVRYDLLESSWRNLAVRALGKAESMWRRARLAAVPRGGQEPELNLRSYFGLMDTPALFRQVVTARYQAACRYTPSVYPGGLAIFRARAQPLAGRGDRDQGWASLVAGGVDVFDVPGHHDSCVSEPHVRHLATLLNTMLTGEAR